MSFYLQDSGSAYWQLGVSTTGREQNVSVGVHTIVTLVVPDVTGVCWQAGITTDGRLTWTAVSPTTPTNIVLTDSGAMTWTVGVTTDGRTLLTKNDFQAVEDGYLPPIGGGFDSIITVW